MKRQFGFSIAILAAGFSLTIFSSSAFPQARQQPPQPSVDALKVQKVRDNLYLITEGGGNTTVFINSKGVVVVDAKLAGWGTPLQEKIKTLTDKPVIAIINTHSHADHTGGNVEFPPGVEIITSENTKINMQNMDFFKKPENARGLPTKTFKDKMTLFSGDDRVEVYAFGPGETSGDTYVVFPAVHVMNSGDQIPQQTVATVNTKEGGSPVKYPDTLAAAAATIKGVDTIITGHDGILTWNDFIVWGQFQKEFLAWVEAERTAGKSVDEATADYKLPDKYTGYLPIEPRRVKAHIQGIYDELGSK
jgi:cyclase